MSGPLHVIRFEYDKLDRLVKVSDQTGAAVEYTYDLQNRPDQGTAQTAARRQPAVPLEVRRRGRLIEQGHMMERADGRHRLGVGPV